MDIIKNNLFTRGEDFKSTYNTSNFSLDTFKSAIEEYMWGKPEPTFEEQMAQKLRTARASIEYRDTWFTPTLEDLKDGDEVEMQSSWGWFKGTYPNILWEETHCNMAAYRGNDDSVEYRFKHATLRKRK